LTFVTVTRHLGKEYKLTVLTVQK